MEPFLNPPQVLAQLEYHKRMVAADFGSGSGGWALPLAKILEDGKVYAIDLLPAPLSALKSRLTAEKILNIEIVCSNIEEKNGSKLKNESVDLVLMTNFLFQVEKKDLVFEEAKRILRAKGKILVVDWKNDSVLGPENGRFPAEKAKEVAKAHGFVLENEFSAGKSHYALVFTKA